MILTANSEHTNPKFTPCRCSTLVSIKLPNLDWSSPPEEHLVRCLQSVWWHPSSRQDHFHTHTHIHCKEATLISPLHFQSKDHCCHISSFLSPPNITSYPPPPYIHSQLRYLFLKLSLTPPNPPPTHTSPLLPPPLLLLFTQYLPSVLYA